VLQPAVARARDMDIGDPNTPTVVNLRLIDTLLTYPHRH
jgi:hypothetical protein